MPRDSLSYVDIRCQIWVNAGPTNLPANQQPVVRQNVLECPVIPDIVLERFQGLKAILPQPVGLHILPGLPGHLNYRLFITRSRLQDGRGLL